MNEEYELKLETIIGRVFEEFRGREAYLIGSASLYLQGIRYNELPHDVDFCIVSDTKILNNYSRYFDYCFSSIGISVDVLVRSSECYKNLTTRVINFRSLSNIPILSAEDCLWFKYELMNRDDLKIDRKLKHFSQFKYLLDTDQLPEKIKEKFVENIKILEQTLL